MDQRNLLLALVISLAILLGFQFFIQRQTPQTAQAPTQGSTQATPSPAESPAAPTPSGTIAPPTPPDITGKAAPEAAAAASREEALALTPRVQIRTPKLRGSISLVGGRLDDLVLTRYHETIDPKSPEIVLLSPEGSEHPYLADFGWLATGGDLPVPKRDTLWQADGDTLAPGKPVTLSWDNGQGLRFEQTYTVDEDYMFTVTQRVVNNGESTVSLAPYGLISRTGTPKTLGFYILHEGLLGVFDGTLDEVKYSKIKDKKLIERKTTGGWLGITDKYWLVALIPDQATPVNARFVYAGADGQDKYQTDFSYATATVAPGGTAETTSRTFAGAKVVTLLDTYRDEYHLPLFDRAVDFGWLWFLTKPLFSALHFFNGLIGNFGVAILVLTVIVKAFFFPLANKSYRSMAKMRKLQPEMTKLRERFKDDKQRLNQEMMTLYRKEGANPMSGCLPIIVQIPVFFALYKVMFVTIEMRHAPFFGWIHDLSAPDPTSLLNAFGLLPWAVPHLGPLEVVNIGVWPLIMGLSMFLQQRLNPQPPDPIQAKVFMFMPIIFTFLLARFPAGLVIYWTWNNTLSILQQYVIMRRAGVPIGRSASTT